MRSKPTYERGWLVGRFCLMLTVLLFLAACQDEVQPLPTVVSVAEVDVVMGETAVSIPLVPTYTPEPVEVVVGSNQVVLTLWHSWQDNEAAVLADLVSAYEVENPDVLLTLIYQANMVEAVETAVPLGEGPDLILMQQDQLGRFAENGLVTPITTQFGTAYLAENFSPAASAAMTWQDEVWGIPVLQDGIAIVYNKSLLDETLIPADSADFNALLTNAITYHETNPDKYLLCNQSLSADSFDVYHAAPIFFGFGGSEEPGYVDEQGNVFINTPQKIAAGEWLLSFMEAAPPDAGYEICQAGFLTGEFASWWTGSWALDTLPDTDFEVGVRAFGRPFTHVTGLFLGANALEREHEAAALDFMNQWTSPTVQAELALAVNEPPAHQQALTSEAVQAQAKLAAFGAAAANGIPFSASSYTEAQWEPMGVAQNNILTTLQSPADALFEAQTAVEQTIQNTKNQ
ncbi:MAG: extracellular solute-binding protein [Anaerolineae bacterium]|nr:extracellular solute-binding protein [Anaerolineae bacterium]